MSFNLIIKIFVFNFIIQVAKYFCAVNCILWRIFLHAFLWILLCFWRWCFPPVPPRVKNLLDEERHFSVREGNSTDIRCYVHGNPQPSVSWLRNGKVMYLSFVTTLLCSCKHLYCYDKKFFCCSHYFLPQIKMCTFWMEIRYCTLERWKPLTVASIHV